MERCLDPSLDRLTHGARNHDSTRRRFCLEPGSHIYGVAVDVILLDDDIAEMKADPEHDRFVLEFVANCLNHRLLEFYRRGERIHRAGELDQRTVALQPDHSSAAADDGRREPSVQML